MSVEVSVVDSNVKLVVICRRRINADKKGNSIFLAQKVSFSDFTYCLFISHDVHL